MSLTDLLVLGFILAAFGVFISTLAWASRPPRKTRKPAKDALRPGYVGTERARSA